MKFFHHIDIQILSSGSIARFTGKLPGKGSVLSGIAITATKHNDTKALANVVVNLNSGRGKSFNQVLMQPAAHQKQIRSLNILEKVEQNSLVTGFVEDFGNSSAYPYTVKITFELEE